MRKTTLPAFLTSTLLFLTNTHHALATTANPNPNGDGCVDPKGFVKCYDDKVTRGTDCVAFCDKNRPTLSDQTYQDCIMGCLGSQLAGNIGCWIQGCWNRVYTCEYQFAAIQYFSDLGLVQNGNIPFYPPPDGRAGECSCNLGYAYGNQTFIDVTGGKCFDAATTGDQNVLSDCHCCEYGIRVSNVLNECPNSNLDILSYNESFNSIVNLISQRTPDECAILDDTSADQCLERFGIEHAGSKIINPLKVQPGREDLSNDLRDSFTEFGAPTFSLALFPAYTTIITPAPYKANAPKETGAPIGTATGGSGGGASTAGAAASRATGSAGGSGSGSSTETGTAAGSTPTGAASRMLGPFVYSSVALVFISVCAVVAL